MAQLVAVVNCVKPTLASYVRERAEHNSRLGSVIIIIIIIIIIINIRLITHYSSHSPGRILSVV